MVRRLDDTVTIETAGGELEACRRQTNLRVLEPLPEPPRSGLEIVQGLEAVVDADGDMADDEPLELIQAVLERLPLGGNVVLEALGAHPIAFL
jgi:hypothetical protein